MGLQHKGGGALRAWAALCLLALVALPLQAQRTLTVAAFPSVDEIIRAAAPAWKALHPDVQLKVVSRQFADHHTAMTTALSTASNLPDVMALEVGYVGRFAQGGGLDDLSAPPFGLKSEAARYVPFALAQGSNRHGAVVAAPTDIGPGTLLYRADLLARSGLAEAELTQSWSSYVAAGLKIKAATGAYLMAHARDMKDIVIRTGLRPGEGLYFDGESRVLVSSPRFVRAFELAREVRRQKLDARVIAWSNEWAEGFKRGTIATQMSGAWLAGHLNHWLAPSTAGAWRAAQLPEGAFVAYGGTFLAVPRGVPPAQKALAWDLIRLLTLERGMQLAAFKAQDAFPALLETFEDPFFGQPIAFLGGQPARLLWRDAARRIQAVAVHKQDAFADEVINTELDKVLDRGKDIHIALADAERLLQRRAHR
jgi:multiple sugar transport system substrate-binding protein